MRTEEAVSKVLGPVGSEFDHKFRDWIHWLFQSGAREVTITIRNPNLK